jgi:hypothetical protein
MDLPVTPSSGHQQPKAGSHAGRSTIRQNEAELGINPESDFSPFELRIIGPFPVERRIHESRTRSLIILDHRLESLCHA